MLDDRESPNRGWMSVREAAALAGVTGQTIYNWIAQGRLHPLQTDHGHQIDCEEFGRFLAVRRAAAATGITLDTLRHWTGEASAIA